MKPFNLEEAIQGKPLVTRDGRKVLDFHYFKNADVAYPVIAVIEGRGSLVEYKANGVFTMHKPDSPNDLFMYEEPKSYYTNIHRLRACSEGIFIGPVYENKEEALTIGKSYNDYIKTIEITVP